ncbi:MAG: GAF domain-containing sensor histidine kinase [Hoeflea sp.]|uniref:GAF domain-containing sensor histidine kinase n=1 Tax=Hoeflea sp. TaxID=1940281 RepID=UPI003EF63E00
MSIDYQRDIDAVQRIGAVPRILDVVCRLTGMGFAAVARVTDERWIACQVLDNVNFGLAPGGELEVETTLCHEIRQHREAIAIDDVAADQTYCAHHTPRIYGLQSYISVPIMLPGDRFFGTLCAIHTGTAKVNNPQMIGTFKLFAELIAWHLDASDQLDDATRQLRDERETAELREQFIAILGHDLRNPIASVNAGVDKMLRDGWTDRSPQLLGLMKDSISRMAKLVDDVMDFARARMGGGIPLDFDNNRAVAETLTHVVEEFRMAHPDRAIETVFDLSRNVGVDHVRLGQLVSNLLGNALTHGSEDHPVVVEAACDDNTFVLTVQNGGAPIPQTALERLFQPFQRGETPDAKGLGLGLFIAAEIARAHGGALTVASGDGSTRFTFSMPG